MVYINISNILVCISFLYSSSETKLKVLCISFCVFKNGFLEDLSTENNIVSFLFESRMNARCGEIYSFLIVFYYYLLELSGFKSLITNDNGFPLPAATTATRRKSLRFSTVNLWGFLLYFFSLFLFSYLSIVCVTTMLIFYSISFLLPALFVLSYPLVMRCFRGIFTLFYDLKAFVYSITWTFSSLSFCNVHTLTLNSLCDE